MEEMIKLRRLLLVFILMAGLSANCTYAQETIKSASEYDYPPFSIVNEKGEADGFSVELLRASLGAVDLDVEFYVGPWAQIKQDLAEGKIQVLPIVGRTPEREEIYDFSVPYKTGYGGIFIRTDETSIATLKDLAEKEILVMKDDNSEEFVLRENVSKNIIATESFEDAFKMLSEGKHDAIVTQQVVGTQLIKKLGITNVIGISRIDKYKQDWTFAVKKGDKERLAFLNEGLSKVITDGTFDIIHDKWFGDTIKTEETFPEKQDLFLYPKKAIRQKAEDIARQVEIYMNAYPDKTLEDLHKDDEFQKIAVQPVGKTGYTTVADYNTLEILFHPNTDLIGVKIDSFEETNPGLWDIAKNAQGGNDASGEYEFPDSKGLIKDKHLYIKIIGTKTADGVGLWVAATAYLDEYENIEKVGLKEATLRISMVWFLGGLISLLVVLLILNGLGIIKLKRNVVMLLLSIAIASIIGLFIFNADNITKELKKIAIQNEYDNLKATAIAKNTNIEQHINHIR
jgi:ABC-type amino acid transport substrate-binding protein